MCLLDVKQKKTHIFTVGIIPKIFDLNLIKLKQLEKFVEQSVKPVRMLSCLSCPTLCNPMDCSPPGSSVHWILQARILEWVAMPSSRESSQIRDRTHVSYIFIGLQVLYHQSHLESPIKPRYCQNVNEMKHQWGGNFWIKWHLRNMTTKYNTDSCRFLKTQKHYLWYWGESEKKVLVAQSYPTLSYPMDCSPPRFSVHGISQARILEWVAISFSRGSSRPRYRTRVFHNAGRFFTVWAADIGVVDCNNIVKLINLCVWGNASLVYKL